MIEFYFMCGMLLVWTVFNTYLVFKFYGKVEEANKENYQIVEVNMKKLYGITNSLDRKIVGMNNNIREDLPNILQKTYSKIREELGDE